MPPEQGTRERAPLGASERPADAVGRRVLAERDALLELLAVFTHDLSNPLQSLIVLCELAADELEPGTEEYQRAKQCVEAAERMRTLVHALAGATRHAEAPRSLEATSQRVMQLLCRRFERHRIDVNFDLQGLETATPPAVCELALLVVATGVVAVANEGSHAGFRLDVKADTAGDRASLVVTTTAVGKAADATPVRLDARHVQRLRDLLEGTSLQADVSPGCTVLSWARTGGLA